MRLRAARKRVLLAVPCLGIAAWLGLCTSILSAHPLSFGSVRIERSERELSGDLVLDVPDAVLSASDAVRRRELDSQLRTGFRLEIGDSSLTPELNVRALGHGPTAVDVVEVRFVLPEGAERVRLVTSAAVGDVAVEWIDRGTSFRVRALVPAGGSSPWVDFRVDPEASPSQASRVLGENATQAATEPAVGRSGGESSRTLFDYLRLGFTHIIPGGADHLLFVTSLALLVPRVPQLLLLVTGFTLGHAVSVALSTFGVASASSRWVEPLIAFSLAYAAVEWRFPRAAALRPFVVTSFGLIHGLGFAGALARVEIAQSERALAIVGFNVGVELGQLIGAGAVVLLLAGIDRHLDPKRVRSWSLIAIAAIGTAWGLIRLFSLGV